MPIWLIQVLVGIVLNVAATLIKGMGEQDKKQVAGVRGTIQSGGDHAPTFIIGRYGTAGKLKYAGTWGEVGGTPNAYYSKVVEVSYLPIRGFSGFFVNGERVTLADTKTGDLGYAVLEYRVNGVDHLWINPYTGSQVAPDPLMRAQFGSDPERPYTADMIGYGLGYFVATALVNRELFPGSPEYLAEVDGIELDDPRAGTPQHDNPIVAIYTLLKGLSYAGQWVYGPQTYSDTNFRLPNLTAEADKCDAPIVLAGGGTMPRFRMGLEVAIDAEPHAIVGELLKACQGRWADVGGVFKFLVGEPGSPVVAITDEDMVITEQQTFEPFPGLESLFNGMTATYPEPGEAWETKEAPPRYRSDLEVADGRRLPFSTDYKAVPYAVQVQELMRAAIEETRRFRRHTQTMPPEWWEYEVLDVAAWTSDRNGYEAKQFLITAMEDLPNANQFVGLQEIDPADYDWSSDYELPWDVAPLVIARPPPQPVSGFYAEPVPGMVAYDAHWAAASVTADVQFVRVSHRTPGATVPRWSGLIPKPNLLEGAGRVTEALVSGELVEVQIEYVPYSGRATIASDWFPVQIATVTVGIDDLTEELRETFEETQEFLDTQLPSIIGELNNLQAQLADIASAPDYDSGDPYDEGDLVKFNGGLYRALQAVPAGTDPTNAAYWEKIGDYASIGEAVAALAAQIDALETEVEATNERARSITTTSRRQHNALLNAAVLNSEQGGNQAIENADQLAAAASIGETMRTEVSRIDDTITAVSEQVEVVQAQVETDIAQAISAVITQVESVGGQVTALVTSLNSLRAVVGESSSEILIKGEAVAAPAGVSARYAIRLQTTNGDGEIIGTATLFADVMPDGTTRWGFSADETVFFAEDGTPLALFDGVNKTFRSANNAFNVHLVTGALVATGFFSLG